MTPRLTPVELRQGGVRDLDDVLELWRRSEASESVSDSVDALRGLLELDAGALLLAEAEGRVVGTLIAAWNGWRGSLYRLAVEPALRRRGVATLLVGAGERRLRERGALRIDALAATGDPMATGFWRSCGYVHQPERARFVRDF